MKVNYIDRREVKGDCFVIRLDEEKVICKQPDRTKEAVGMFNYWDECKRGNLSDDAKLHRLVIDYDDGARRVDVEKQFEDYSYVIYNSTGNQLSKGIEKFRIIIQLKEPIIASDLEHWRTTDKFKKYFEGCDYSSFAIGRFFYRPSRYDKDHEEVKISFHKGEPFDFYEMFQHYVKNEAFEKIVNKMKFGNVCNLITSDKYVNRFMEKIGYDLHYPDIPKFVLKAKYYEVEYNTAKQIFASRYAGNSKWEKNFEECWMTFNPNRTISQK